MEKLISDELRLALCEQVGHEMYNSHLYLYIAGVLKNKGLDNLAKIFEGQHQEESSHAKMIFDFLTDLNADVHIPEINLVNIQFGSIMDIAHQYLAREIVTTSSLDEIKKIAQDENPVAEEFLRDMIKLQRHEYEEASGFVDRAEIVGNDWMNALIWDLSLR